MAPTLRKERTPSSRLVDPGEGSQPVTASQAAKATTRKTSTGRSTSRQKKVAFRSRSARSSKKSTPVAGDGEDASTASEDSPSQGRDRPPPSAQRSQPESTATEGDVDTDIPDIEELLNQDVAFLNEVYVANVLQFARGVDAADLDLKELLTEYQELLNKKFSCTKEMARPPVFGPVGIVLAGKKDKKVKHKETLGDICDDVERRLFPVRNMLAMYWRLKNVHKVHSWDIEMVIRWEYQKEVLLDEDSSSEATGEEEENSTQRRRRKSSSKKRKSDKAPTASQRQRASNANLRQIEEMVGDNILEIQSRYQCKVASCRNYPKPCVVVSGEHFFLNTMAVKKWNQLIRDGDATVRECPASVIGDLMQDRRRNEARKTGKVANVGLPGQGQGININLGGPWGGGFPAPAAQEVPQSSPPTRSGDDDVNMTLYMAWLETQYPTLQFEINGVASKLQEHGWGFSDLRDIRDDQWEKMRIKGGFIKKIKRHLRVWANLPAVGGGGWLVLQI